MAETTLKIVVDDQGGKPGSAPASTGAGAGSSPRSPGGDIGAKIDEILDRVAGGKLSGQEGLDRLDRLSRSDRGRDYIRDTVGSGTDARQVLQDALNTQLMGSGQAPVLRTTGEQNAATKIDEQTRRDMARQAENDAKKQKAEEERAKKQAENDAKTAKRDQDRADAASRLDALNKSNALTGATRFAAQGGSLGEGASAATGLARAGLLGGGRAAAALAGPIGIAVVAAASAIDIFAGAVKDTVDKFVARGRELAEFDARLAAASAEMDVRKLERDLDISAMQGENLSKLMNQSSNIEDSFARFMAPLENELIGLLTKFLGPIEKVGQLVEKLPLETMAEVLSFILVDLNPVLMPTLLALDGIDVVLEEVLRWFNVNKKKKDEDALNQMMADLFAAGTKGPGDFAPVAGPDRREAAMKRAANMPLGGKAFRAGQSVAEFFGGK